jgi:N-acetylneuraminate synthase
VRTAPPTLKIGDRHVGAGNPIYVIAEVSANHAGDVDRAEAILRAAAGAGADAVKFQVYRPDTMTIDADGPDFRIGAESLWAGRTLHNLYDEVQTPWDWMPRLFGLGHDFGVDVFASAFDAEAVAFLEQFDPPAYKLASFELVDLELIDVLAATGRPLIMSTGMASIAEIDEALTRARSAGVAQLALLRCNSGYPTPPEDMDLATIPDMIRRWNVPVGLSDHTLGTVASIAAVALGASLVERHVTLDRSDPTADAAFSLEPPELARLVCDLRDVERAIGDIRYGPTASERPSLEHRRSLYVVEDIPAGGVLDRRNVRAIRPGHGLAPRELPEVLGRRVREAVPRGTPLSWGLLDDG